MSVIRGDGFELDTRLIPLGTALLEPRCEVFALAHVEGPKLVAALGNSLHANTGDTDAATYGQIFQG